MFKLKPQELLIVWIFELRLFSVISDKIEKQLEVVWISIDEDRSVILLLDSFSNHEHLG